MFYAKKLQKCCKIFSAGSNVCHIADVISVTDWLTDSTQYTLTLIGVASLQFKRSQSGQQVKRRSPWGWGVGRGYGRGLRKELDPYPENFLLFDFKMEHFGAGFNGRKLRQNSKHNLSLLLFTFIVFSVTCDSTRMPCLIWWLQTIPENNTVNRATSSFLLTVIFGFKLGGQSPLILSYPLLMAWTLKPSRITTKNTKCEVN